jgi:hypothetical protein
VSLIGRPAAPLERRAITGDRADPFAEFSTADRRLSRGKEKGGRIAPVAFPKTSDEKA